MQTLPKKDITTTPAGNGMHYITIKETGARLNFNHVMDATLTANKYRDLLGQDVTVLMHITPIDVPLFYLLVQNKF
jgi:hypothetical protein